MTDDRRLIEDYLPIEAISAEASREKSVRKGHISTLQLCGLGVPWSLAVPPSTEPWCRHRGSSPRGLTKRKSRPVGIRSCFTTFFADFRGQGGVLAV
jgi:Protein of unknown function (DUF1156)